MRLTISHSTTYSYDSPDHYALQQLRLRPKTGAGQRVIEWSTEISGGIKQLSYDDHHDNHVDLVVIEKDAMEITITSRGVVEVEDQMGVVGRMRGLSPMWLFESPTEVTEPGPGLRRLAKAVIGAQKTIGLEQLHHLSAAILADVRYDKGQTDATLVAEAALAAGHGVCQDHAHIFITVARLLGYPARYVSGYLLLEGQTEQEATHAWAEAWVEPLGWVGFDVSNGISPDARYVRVATGRDYGEAAPIHGLRMGAGRETMAVRLQVAAVAAQ
ncbi:MAG TPA: transglutaminase [Rhodobacteraceae bacterium]|jgi:transglutaminase-like putative cysteine protease|nr:transglutaminase [Paracoccaceae bacterium]HBV55617.1 transglutaminase [Paracoccaceae bacterium]